MKQWKQRWNEMLPYEKGFEVASWVIGCLTLISMVLEIMAAIRALTLPFAVAVITSILFVLCMACAAVVYWRKERHFAHFLIFLAILFGFSAIRDIVGLFI